MQAIQSIENAAMQVPRRRSPFRALLWKEWRQQRWIFLSLAGLAYALLVAAATVVWPDRYKVIFENARNDWAGLLACCAAFFAICSIVVLSANAFSGERDDNTDLFLETIPCSRSKLFRVKLGFVLLLALLELIPVGTALLVYIGRQPSVRLEGLAGAAGLTVLTLAATVLVLVTVPAMIASFGGSVIATILASMPVIVACFAYLSLAVQLTRFLPLRSVMMAGILAALFVALLLATALLAAWRMWIRVERTWRHSLRMAAALAGLLVVYLAVPLAGAYLYVTLFAPLSFFLSSAGGFVGAWNPPLSPGGKCVTFDTYYSGWGRCTRAACLDVDSGRTRWLTLLRNSFVWPLSGIWSHSGNQFVLEENGQWLWPLARETANHIMLTYSVVNARSGEKRSFSELCPGLPQMPSDVLPLVGWYSDQVFAFQNGRDMFFADIENHEVRQCKMPAVFPSARLGNAFQLPITRRGIFVMPEDVSAKGEVSVLRYAPDLPEAECLTLRGIGGEQPNIEASEDGQWLLLHVSWLEKDRRQRSWYLAQLADGAKATLLVCAEGREKSAIPSSWQVKNFLPGGHQILLYRDAEVGLFDADSRDLRRIPMTQASSRQIVAVALSPAGGFALVQCDNPATSGKPGAISRYVIVDVHNGTSLAVDEATHEWWQNLRWLGEDHLLSEENGKMPWTMNRDGTGARPLLAE